MVRAQLGGDTFDLKRTEWKKLQPFLLAQQFLTIRTTSENGQNIDKISIIDRSHPEIRAYKRQHECLIATTDEEEAVQLKIVDLYVFPSSVATAIGIVPEEVTANASTVERRGTNFLTKQEGEKAGGAKGRRSQGQEERRAGGATTAHRITNNLLPVAPPRSAPCICFAHRSFVNTQDVYGVETS